jgi:hypothetical protein
VATSQHWKDIDGQVQEATAWTRCIAWGTVAELCAQSVSKSSRVYVTGRLHTLRGQDVQTGEGPARAERLRATERCHALPAGAAATSAADVVSPRRRPGYPPGTRYAALTEAGTFLIRAVYLTAWSRPLLLHRSTAHALRGSVVRARRQL